MRIMPHHFPKNERLLKQQNTIALHIHANTIHIDYKVAFNHYLNTEDKHFNVTDIKYR